MVYMRFIISNGLFERHEDYICGVVIARGCSNNVSDPDISQMMLGVQEQIRKGLKLENLSQEPFVRNWRNAYSKFGSSPSKYKASSESLIRRTLKGERIPMINPLVDIYNYISLKYRTPVGGEDIRKIRDPLELRMADGTEKFTKLGSEDTDPIKANEVIYVDGSNTVLCRRWNWRESDLTKLTEETKDAIIEIEALEPVTKDMVAEAVKEASLLIERVCRASTRTYILSKTTTEIEF